MTENKELMELLKCARKSHFEIEAQLLHIERLHDVIERTRDLTRVQIYTDRLAELEPKINASINKAADADSEVQHLLNKLNSEEKAVLYRYYILGEDWRKIADKMNYSERSVFLIRKRALENLNKIYIEGKSCNMYTIIKSVRATLKMIIRKALNLLRKIMAGAKKRITRR